MTTFPPQALRAAQDGALADNDHIAFLGDDHTWFNVGELRRARTAELRTAQEDDMKNYIPPNPYGGLTALRAANADVEQKAEDNWKVGRQRAIDAESRRLAEWIEANPLPRLTNLEDDHTYAPPDGYRIALDALKEN